MRQIDRKRERNKQRNNKIIKKYRNNERKKIEKDSDLDLKFVYSSL